jgi:hypothetical protein
MRKAGTHSPPGHSLRSLRARPETPQTLRRTFAAYEYTRRGLSESSFGAEPRVVVGRRGVVDPRPAFHRKVSYKWRHRVILVSQNTQPVVAGAAAGGGAANQENESPNVNAERGCGDGGVCATPRTCFLFRPTFTTILFTAVKLNQ